MTKPSKKKSKSSLGRSGSSESTSAVDEYVPGALSSMFSSGTSHNDVFDKNNDFTVEEPVCVVTAKKEEKADGQQKSRTAQRLNRKRKDKKKTKKITVEAEDEHKETVEEKKKEVEKDGKMDAEEKERTVFIGNVPTTVSKQQLKKIFADCGKIDSIRVRGVVGKTQTITKKIAYLSGKVNEHMDSLIYYIKFEKKESVPAALEKNGTVLDEHKLRVDGCAKKKAYNNKMTVFVGGLPFECTETQLDNWAEKHVGPTKEVRVVRDGAMGLGKGFGFVTFADLPSVQLALSLQNPKIKKHQIRITKVLKKKQLRKGKPMQSGSLNKKGIKRINKRDIAKQKTLMK